MNNNSMKDQDECPRYSIRSDTKIINSDRIHLRFEQNSSTLLEMRIVALLGGWDVVEGDAVVSGRGWLVMFFLSVWLLGACIHSENSWMCALTLCALFCMYIAHL